MFELLNIKKDEELLEEYNNAKPRFDTVMKVMSAFKLQLLARPRLSVG